VRDSVCVCVCVCVLIGFGYVYDVRMSRTNFAQTGGAIYCESERTVSIRDSLIEFNDAITNGGGICLSRHGVVMVQDSTIQYVFARLCQRASEPESDRVILHSWWGCRYNAALDGAGVAVRDIASMFLMRVTLRRNVAVKNGGGALVDNGALITITSSNITYAHAGWLVQHRC
jgi:hypothetical protein